MPRSFSVSLTTFMYGIVVVNSAEMPRMSGLCLASASRYFHRIVDAEIDDLESGALEHHRYQVLADVVNVALDGADDDLADRFHTGFRQQRPQDLHAALHRVRGQQHFGHKQDAIAK